MSFKDNAAGLDDISKSPSSVSDILPADLFSNPNDNIFESNQKLSLNHGISSQVDVMKDPLEEEEEEEGEFPMLFSASQRLKVFKVSYFYCVYLLNSINKRTSFYIGSTPNPSRRLQQHNGHRTMGAKRTKRENLRPWEMVTIIHGFCSNIAALQFETALQKPHLTRHIHDHERIVKKAGGKKSIHQHLANVRLLLKSRYFSRMNLKVEFFSYEEVYKWWIENKFGVFLNHNVATIHKKYQDAGECFIKDCEMLESQVKKFEEIKLRRSKTCGSSGKQETDSKGMSEENVKFVCDICDKEIVVPSSSEDQGDIKKRAPLLYCYHGNCHFVSHVQCLARRFLKEEINAATDKENNNNNVGSTNSQSKYFSNPSFSQLSQTTKRLVSNRIQESMSSSRDYIRPIVPVKGKCPDCLNILHWSQLIRVVSNLP